jgi:UDP-3-O-[3-hydroxymyristoyl] glucosamine N-acyltransferase
MEFSAEQIANILEGTVEGDKNVKVSNLSKIEEGKPGTLSFLANLSYARFIYDSDASIVIVNESFKPEKKTKATLIRVKDAYTAFAKLLEFYQQNKPKKIGISPKSHIPENAEIGENVYIGEFTVVGDNTSIGNNCRIYPNVTIGDNVKIGNNTTIYAGVKIYDDSVIGNDCTLHAGVVIGSDGFGFAPQQNTDFKKVPQIGNVVIEDRVEIGSNTVVDRATLGSTIIKKGVKLDNLIQIAHNVVIGENTVIAAQSGISGSTKVGKNCMLGGQAGLIGHLTIADDVKIAAQAGVTKSIKQQGAVVEGSPAFSFSDYQRSYIHFRRFDSIVKRINELERKIKDK